MLSVVTGMPQRRRAGWQGDRDQGGPQAAGAETGWNDPLIMLNDLSDADLAKAADLAVAGATKNLGQRCTAIKRILLQKSVADRSVPLVLECAKALRCGDPMDPSTDLGCVSTNALRKPLNAGFTMPRRRGPISFIIPAGTARCCRSSSSIMSLTKANW